MIEDTGEALPLVLTRASQSHISGVNSGDAQTAMISEAFGEQGLPVSKQLLEDPDETVIPLVSSCLSRAAGSDEQIAVVSGVMREDEPAIVSTPMFHQLLAHEIIQIIPRLKNPGNACYQNALVYALLASYLSTGIESGRITDMLGSASTVELASHRWFQPLLADWPEPKRQHDIAEFPQHLLLKLGWAIARWEGRQVLAGILQTTYTCMPMQSILLPLPSEQTQGTTLQQTIDSWHAGIEGIRGLVSQHAYVMLQLDRFTLRATRALKNRVHVQIPSDRIVQLPCFEAESSIDCQDVAFRLLAIMIHLGPGPENGHYVCLWWRGERLIHHDDAQTSILSELSSQHCCNMYLIIVVRCTAIT